MKNIFNLILFSVILCTSQNAFAERYILMFGASWCRYCPPAKAEVLANQDAKAYKIYDIDVDKFPLWKRAYKVESLPTIVIADLEPNKATMQYKWSPGDKNSLGTIIRHFIPKKP